MKPASGDTRRPCKLCGAPLIFVVNHRTGRTVPLDEAPVWVYTEDDRFGAPRNRNDRDEPRLIRRKAWRNHRETCTGQLD